MTEEIQEPKDLGIKIATKEEKAWTDIQDRATLEIEQNQRVIEIDQMIVKLAQQKIKAIQKETN